MAERGDMLEPSWQYKGIEIYQGDCLDVLTLLPEKSVQCCVTSPPYWGLRSYLPDDHVDKSSELGSEKTPEEYVAKMVDVFRGVWRVLRNDGTVWLNLGDSYGAVGGDTHSGFNQRYSGTGGPGSKQDSMLNGVKDRTQTTGLRAKNLMGIPWRVAFALQADGWYLRQDIIWAKPNPMPESITDRCTKAHEYIFLLSKQPRYFFDADAIREKTGNESEPADYFEGDGRRHFHESDAEKGMMQYNPDFRAKTHPNGRNKRSVWTVATQPYPGAHFAVFSGKLIEPCILAGTSNEGCCPECDAPWTRVTEKTQLKRERPADRTSRHEAGEGVNSCGNTVAGVDVQTIGWEPSCDHYPFCDAETNCGYDPSVPCTVLDPFAGVSTTGVVAQKNGRHYIGIELNQEYIDMSITRLQQPGLF